MIFANMHNHSTFSDGIYTPEQLVELAKSEGYRAVVLSDHDTVRGYYFMQKAARCKGLLTMLGCEFSTDGFGENFHLLGYDFNPYEAEMEKLLNYASQRELKRTGYLLERALKRGSLAGITWDEVRKANPYNDYLCNNHIFNLLVEKGLYKREDYLDFFNPNFRYTPQLEQEITDYIQMPHPNISYVIKTIIGAGGVPVLAHPHNQIQYVSELIKEGLMGIEVKHDMLTDDEASRLTAVAQENKLYMTGGTDHNGVLGGYMHLSEQYYVDPQKAGADDVHFMELYTRKLG